MGVWHPEVRETCTDCDGHVLWRADAIKGNLKDSVLSGREGVAIVEDDANGAESPLDDARGMVISYRHRSERMID